MTKLDAKPETYTIEAEVRVTRKDGTQVVEIWHGISKRHALGRARDKYRGVARADFADGEPWSTNPKTTETLAENAGVSFYPFTR